MGEVPGGAMQNLPAPPKKGSGLLKTVGIPLVTFLVGIGVGVAAAPDDGGTLVAAPAESPSESVEGSDSPSPSPTPSPSPSPTRLSEPEASTACDPAMNNPQGTAISSLEALRLRTAVRSMVRTRSSSHGYSVMERRSRRSRRPSPSRPDDSFVFLRHPSDIDEVLNFQDHPDSFDSKNCRTRVAVS